MTDRDSPVTVDELHAFADGVLPTDRKDAVEAWLATHPDDKARVAEWRTQTQTIRSRYGAVATEPIPERLNLDRILRSGRKWRAVAAAAALAAFLVGGAVGWFAHGASAAAPSRFDLFTAQALDVHKLYVVEVRHPVEVPGEERAHLVQWLSKRLNIQLTAPDLESVGLKLVGGRLLPGPSGGPSAFFMYESASGERYTLYAALSTSPETGMRYKEDQRFAAFYWVDHSATYVVSGPSDRKRLWGVVKAAYDQIDKMNSAKSSG